MERISSFEDAPTGFNVSLMTLVFIFLIVRTLSIVDCRESTIIRIEVLFVRSVTVRLPILLLKPESHSSATFYQSIESHSFTLSSMMLPIRSSGPSGRQSRSRDSSRDGYRQNGCRCRNEEFFFTIHGRRRSGCHNCQEAETDGRFTSWRPIERSGC
jgi:hypothetical protein